jgi:aryl-phospho-beta-D-glucosidase BglC (GH1 family)
MKKVALLIVGLVLFSIPLLAGEYLMNDTGETVYGLRVVFSEPVTLASFGDILMVVAPTGESTEFMFSGGLLEEWAGHWFNWEPALASLVNHEWIETSASLNEVHGTCAYVDTTYGIPIVVSSITARDLRAAGIRIGDEITLMMGSTVLTMPLDYPPSCVPEGGCLAYMLWGYLRIYKRAGDFPATFGVQSGTPITIRLAEKGKYVYSSDEIIPKVVAGMALAQSTEVGESVDFAEGVELGPLHVEGNRIVDASGEARVLRGAVSALVDSASYGKWRPLFRRDLELLKSRGGSVVTIPIHARNFLDIGASKYMEEYLDPVIKWAGELDLYLIIHWKGHGNPADQTNHGADPRLIATFEESVQSLRYISHRYKDCQWVMYGVWNEPGALVRWEEFRYYMTALVDVVRMSAPNSLVLVPGVNIAANLLDIVETPIERKGIIYATDVYPWVWHRLPWQEEAKALLDAGYPLFMLEWGFSDDEEHGHYATREEFSSPLLSFCEVNGISWTVHQWILNPDSGTFTDYESTQLTERGRAVYDGLAAGCLIENAYSSGDFPGFAYEVYPKLAVDAGCEIVDRLDGEYPDVPMTILEARPALGWKFDHWEGPIDWPEWRVISVDLESTDVVRCVFSETPEGQEARLKAEAEAAFNQQVQSALSSWIETQQEAPIALEYDQYVEPSFHRSGPRDLSESRFWHESGTLVESLRVGLTDDALQIAITLQEGETIGKAGYVVVFRSSTDDVFFFLRPSAGCVQAKYSRWGRLQHIIYLCDDQWSLTDNTLSVAFPLAVLAEASVTIPASLSEARVTLEVDYIEGAIRELFVYPGSASMKYLLSL